MLVPPRQIFSLSHYSFNRLLLLLLLLLPNLSLQNSDLLPFVLRLLRFQYRICRSTLLLFISLNAFFQSFFSTFSFAMADSPLFSFSLFLLFSLLLHTTVSAADPPQISPSPSSPSLLLSPPSPSPEVSSPSPSPSVHAPLPAPASSPLASSESSPPAPSPVNQSPVSSPSPSPSPSPAPADSSIVSHADLSGGEAKEDSSSGGMNAGKKAGVVLGVIAAAGVIVLASFIYKKRQQNIRRAQYAYESRREIL